MHRVKENFKNKKNLSKLWDIFEKPNIIKLESPKDRNGKRGSGQKKYLKLKMADICPYLVKPINPQMSEQISRTKHIK